MADSAQHQDDAAILKRNNLKFHLLLAEASGNPIVSVLMESVIYLLEEIAFEFLDLSLERHFFQIHNGIVQVIAKRQSEEVKRLIEQDILEIKEKLKAFFEGDKEDCLARYGGDRAFTRSSRRDRGKRELKQKKEVLRFDCQEARSQLCFLFRFSSRNRSYPSCER